MLLNSNTMDAMAWEVILILMPIAKILIIIFMIFVVVNGIIRRRQERAFFKRVKELHEQGQTCFIQTEIKESHKQGQPTENIKDKESV